MSFLSFFSFLSRSPKGLIRVLGLSDWWLNELSSGERRILKHHLGDQIDEGTPYEPEYYSAFSFLALLATHLRAGEREILSRKIGIKALRCINDDRKLARRFYGLSDLIKGLYAARTSDPECLQMCLQCCDIQAKLGLKAYKKLLSDTHEAVGPEYLPGHPGYDRLSIYYMQNKQPSKVIEICRHAIQEGWSGDWNGRILRAQKQMQ